MQKGGERMKYIMDFALEAKSEEVTLRDSRIRKKHLGVLVWLVLLLTVALSLAAGCGDDDDTDTGTVATAVDENETATAAEVAEQVVTTVVTEPCPESAPAPSGCTAVEFVSLNIDKTTVSEGEMITFTAEIKGDAKGVSVIFGGSGGDISTTHSISAMTSQGTNGDITTWQTSAFAPPGAAHLNGGSFFNGFAISQDDVQTMSPSQGSYSVTGP
jgi:hypothetical protein